MFVSSSIFVNAQCSKIHFINSSISYAKQKADKEEKHIFVFIYELGESKAEFFESAIFYKRGVCEKFNENFINIKAKSSSSLAQSLIRRYRIDELPAFIILDERGQRVAETSKIKGTNDLLRFAEKAE